MVMWVIIITLLLSSASFSFVNFYILIFSETTALIGIKLGKNAHGMVLYKVDVFFCLEIYYRNKRPQGAKQFFLMLTVNFSSSFDLFSLSYVSCEVVFMLYTWVTPQRRNQIWDMPL
jgi:hypothetical protein